MLINLSHVNNMVILGANRFIPKGFELGTRVSRIARFTPVFIESVRGRKSISSKAHSQLELWAR